MHYNVLKRGCDNWLVSSAHLLVCDEGVAARLAVQRPRLVEQHVELFDFAALLHDFQELKPIGGTKNKRV